jgi:P2 family phage contractile tail tube protein
MRPGVSKYYNLFVENVGFLGKIEDFKEPDVKSMKAESSLGYKIDIGVPEAMEAEVAVASVNTIIYDAMAKMDKPKFTIKKVVIEDGKEVTISHTIVGPFDADQDNTKIKETKKVKLKLYPHQYTKEVNGKEVVFVDVFAPILRLNGKDALEETRQAII